jgi:hypothetical protein
MRSFIYIFFLIFSFDCLADKYRYKFNWLNIPVSTMDMTIHNGTLITSNGALIEFSIELLGPLNLFRQYQSNVIINYDDVGWDYFLNGIDRGQTEVKKIYYRNDDLPSVKIFIDDKDKIAKESKNRGAIDPFTFFLRSIERLKIDRSCDNDAIIFDGKRSYRAQILTISNEEIDLTQCRFIMYTGTKPNSDNVSEKRNNWPFNKNERYMDVWYSRKIDYIPIKFTLNTPIGKIIGNIIEEFN